MLTEEQRARIEALTDDELELEFARGRASRFQREKFDYLKVVLDQRKQARIDATSTAALKVAQEGVRATKDGTRWATTGWVVTGLIAVAAIAMTVIMAK